LTTVASSVFLAPAFSTKKPNGTCPFHGIGDADHGAFRDRGMRGQHFFDRAGGETMAGDIDDVVRARHHED